MPSTPETRPLVSVVIPTYRRAGVITKSLRSVLDQTLTDLEVIVVDDAGGDNTEEVVAGLGDERVRYLCHETNRGGNAARQTGIDASRGTWVAFLDSDDFWVPEKLEKQLARAEETGAGFCYGWFDFLTPSGDDGELTVTPARQVFAEGRALPEFVIEQAVGTFSTMMVLRSVLDEVGGLNTSLPSCQDWDFVVRANRVTSFCVVPEVVTHYWQAVNDPYRITNNSANVLRGLHHMHAMFTTDFYPRMTPEQVAASKRFLMSMMANHGDIASVVRVGVKDDPQGTARYLVRAVRHRARTERAKLLARRRAS